MEETVLHYARNAKAAGLDGVVCSPLEAAHVKEACGAGFLTVTPGIRFAGSAPGSPMNPQIHWGGKDDQSRIATPANAAGLGCDYIVVGRPIIAAEDPLGAYRRCVKEFLGQ
jgi:orotidine-5'-phosphate decarboxylase